MRELPPDFAASSGASDTSSGSSSAAFSALVKRLPDVSWGVLIALAVWASELYYQFTIQRLGVTAENLPKDPPPELMLAMSLFVIMGLGASVFYYFCVYRFHQVVCAAPGWQHPVTPRRAVGFHFIPFYNFYWVCKWPLELGRFLGWCMPKPGISWQLGLVYIAGQLLGLLVSPAASVFVAMALLTYVQRRMKAALEYKAVALAERAVTEAYSG